MDVSQAVLLREALAGSGLPERADVFARALRRSTRSPGGLLLAGPAGDEPWHLTAHLDDEARFSGRADLRPTLLRWNVHPGDPAHLRVSLDRLTEARRGESVLVVTERVDPSALDPLLERIDDARHRGAAVFAVEEQRTELAGLATETLTMSDFTPGLASFDGIQHLTSLAIGRDDLAKERPGLRNRLGRLLDAWAGGPT